MIKIFKEYIKIPTLIKFSLFSVLIIRLILLTQPSFKIDMNDWQLWAARLIDVGPMNFYTPNIFADYLPFFYFLLWVAAEVFNTILGKAAIFSSSFELYIKTISNIFDFLTAYTIFLIVKKYSQKWAALGSILYLFNPSIIFNSSVWGQIDSIPTFFLTYSLYQLEERKNIITSSVTGVFSFLIKPLNVSLLPIMFLRAIKSFAIKKIILAAISGVLVFFIISLFFFTNDPIFGGIKHFLASINMYPYASINAYNFWALFGWWQSDAAPFFGLTPHIWGYVLYGIVLFAIFIPYFKRKIKIEVRFDYFAYALSSFGFFLFLTRIHERHLFPVFALLIISACIFKSRVLIVCYICLAIINAVNLFYSYYYYNVFYNNPMMPKNIIFDISANGRLAFSLFSLVIFGIMFAVYFKSHRLLKKGN